MPPRFGVAAPKCARCDKSVYQAEQVIGPAARPYHKACLTCIVCGKRLDSTLLLEHEGEPYCKNCHKAHLGQGKGGFGTAVPLKPNIPRSPPTSSPARTPAYGSPSFGSAAVRASAADGGTPSRTFDSTEYGTPTRSSRPTSPSKLGRVLADDFGSGSPARDRADPMLDLADEVGEIRVTGRGQDQDPGHALEDYGSAAPPTEPTSSRGFEDDRAVQSIDDAIAAGAMPRIVARSTTRPGAAESLAPQPGMPIPSKYVMGSSDEPSPAPAPEPAPVPASADAPMQLPSYPVYTGNSADAPSASRDSAYEPSAAEVIAAVRAGKVPGSPKKASAPLSSVTDSTRSATIGSVPVPMASPAAYSSQTVQRPSRPETPPQPKSYDIAASSDMSRSENQSQTYAPSTPSRYEPPAPSTPSRNDAGAPAPRLPSPTRPDMSRFNNASATKTAPRDDYGTASGPTTPVRQAAPGGVTSSPSFSPGINRLGLSSSVASAAKSGTPLCARCERPVYFAEQIQASGRKWHRGCLRCEGCSTTLEPSKLEEGPADQVAKGCNTWCRTCYAKYFGPKGIKVGMSLPEGLRRNP